ncbi:DUF4825 domain-containing protein [Gottfriedia acidiceleris]|uniref:DUF4825 domain-containing protein n=1 Tax=Gottfriedia acidiceleris TaxID=371036 RepID=A0ABY4JJ77_9BACI|nr:DUF4825 domain-containing protein [Gottfriedia acidiceleris]UPM52883.1 DUF4825 domain-containing protein [Gottfriedia acidiceleris]
MKKILGYLILILLLISLTCCSFSNTHTNKDIFHYKNSYVGNNSAVGSIIKRLPNHNEFTKMSLQTKKKPYSITIEYKNLPANTKNIIINNATYLFALIQNVESIVFDFADQKYTVTRQQLDEWYGKDLSSYTNEKELEKLIHSNLNNKNKIGQLFRK